MVLWLTGLCMLARAVLGQPSDALYGHFLVRATAPTSPRLSGDAMADVCASLYRDDVFLCHYNWRDGAGGKRHVSILDRSELLERINANPLVARLGAVFEEVKDFYTVTPVGIYEGRRYNSTSPATYSFGRRLSAPAPHVAPIMQWLGPRASSVAPGHNVTVYLVDQRMDLEHPEYHGRVDGAFLSLSANLTRTALCAAEHGTHLASLVGGNTFGVYPHARFVSVAVSAGCGVNSRASELVAGLDWILARLPSPLKEPTVVAISMQVPDEGAGSVVSDMVEQLLQRNVTVLAAAGDAADESCLYTPASRPGVIAVAAANMTRPRAGQPWESTNYGSCVALWAPGAALEGASASPPATAVFSGTSQAMAVATGIAARVLAERPDLTPAQVRTELQAAASLRVLQWNTPDTVWYFSQVPGGYGGYGGPGRYGGYSP